MLNPQTTYIALLIVANGRSPNTHRGTTRRQFVD